jgi:hypothetical protein
VQYWLVQSASNAQPLEAATQTLCLHALEVQSELVWHDEPTGAGAQVFAGLLQRPDMQTT